MKYCITTKDLELSVMKAVEGQWGDDLMRKTNRAQVVIRHLDILDPQLAHDWEKEFNKQLKVYSE